MTESDSRHLRAAYPVLLETLKGHGRRRKEALLDIYCKAAPRRARERRRRPRCSTTSTSTRRYDLAKVGATRSTRSWPSKPTPRPRPCPFEDIVATVMHLLALHQGRQRPRWHLKWRNLSRSASIMMTFDNQNRFIRAVGESLSRPDRPRPHGTHRARAHDHPGDGLTPQTLINIRPVVAAIRSSLNLPASQFMDQNPLAGLDPQAPPVGPSPVVGTARAWKFETTPRTTASRMCPIESPGSNIVLLACLQLLRGQPFGFIGTPYRVVENGQLIDEIRYLNADDEKGQSGSSPLEADGSFFAELTTSWVPCRRRRPDSSSPAIASTTWTSPPARWRPLPRAFWPCSSSTTTRTEPRGREHAASGRVPLLTTEALLVGTGMELRAAHDSGEMIRRPLRRRLPRSLRTYRRLHGRGRPRLLPASRSSSASNPGNCTNQRVIVDEGDRVEAGDVLADGPA